MHANTSLEQLFVIQYVQLLHMKTGKHMEKVHMSSSGFMVEAGFVFLFLCVCVFVILCLDLICSLCITYLFIVYVVL